MEKFLKPFLEKGGAYSLGKVPIAANGTADNNIKLLQKVIFKHDILVEFKEVLNSVCSSEPFTVSPVKGDTAKKTIKRLTEFLLSDEDVIVKTEVFCCVFQTFAAGCKGDTSLPLMQFFLVLCHILGMNALPNVNHKKATEENDYLINVDNIQNAFNVHTPSTCSDSFHIFKELLYCLTKTSVNLNSSDVQAYNKWLQKLLKNLAHSQPFQSVLMEIFLISADLDLKLLEGNLEYIFCNILAQRLPVDKNFSDSFETFLCKTLNICAKFQRIVKFTTKFISCIKSTPTEFIRELILPSSVTNEFAKIVSTTSNQQCLSILEILVQSVDECFTDISQNNSGTKLLLSITSELLIYFLKEVKLFAPSIASATLQRFIDKLSIFQQSLQKFGNFLFSSKTFISKNEEIVKIFLELGFYCGEIQTMINCYKDSVLQPSDEIQPKTDCDWQCCLSLDQWDKLVNLSLKSKLKSFGTVCFQLALQKLRNCKLEKVTPDADESTLKIIIFKLTSSHEEFNILQQVAPEDFALVMEVLTTKQCKSVTKNILKQMLENKSESAIWLSNLTLQENSVFIASLFSELLRETGNLLDNITEKNQSRFSWLLEEYFDEGNSVRVEAVEGLPVKVNHVLKNFKKIRKSLSKNSEHKAPLGRIVEIFKLLPLPQMKDDFRRLGLSFAVGIGTILTEDENSILLVFESICNFLASDMDASTSLDIGLCIKWLSELSYEKETDDLKLKVIENLVRNSPNMKNGLNQVGEMIDCSEGSKHADQWKALETRVFLYNELGKCWQRAKKRKSDNDLIGSFRTKLAKMISEEAKELEEENINLQNCKILLKILAIEINKAVKANDKEEMENLMKQKFPSYFDFVVKSLKNGFDEPSAVFLTVTLQALPKLREFLPGDAILKIWKSVRVYEKMNFFLWRLFCTHSTDKEFEEVLTDLLKMSKKFLNSDSNKHSSNCFEIWVSFFEFSTESKRNSCQLRLQELFNYIHECHLLLKELPIKKKNFLIKFFSFCLTNKEVVITSHVLDTIILVVLECLDDSPSVQEFHELFTVEVEVASAILSRQFAWSKSKVHLTFVIFKRLLSSLMNKCNARQEVNKEDVIMLSSCAFCLEKWTSVMAKKEKDFARTSAYFITALISSIASVTVVPAVKFHLINCINHFLSISDSHTVAYLMRILKPGYQQVFNTAYNQFKKYHKYSGKI